ncbi:MAG: GNAT family N-acetyltransferase [Oscillospiraceae bacterium]|nr:GNAT family N-acetyltransferase [Oscillospiraceae bacterium]
MNHIGTQDIETKRLLLRRFTIEDAPAMYCNWANDPQVTRYLTWQPHHSAAESERLLCVWVMLYAKPETYRWCIADKHTDEPIGCIDAVEQDRTNLCATAGYCLTRRLWGHGIMTEALTAMEDFLFSKGGYNRIQAFHNTQNPASGKVMQKSGMRREGILRQYHQNNQGRLVDVVLWSILRSEWQAMGRG